ncbi:uncharacterized protein LOC110847885 [Folsomia candida]|uniref:Uncharacterized protein n=1 Tax=Folsomia candida TaxID=158441 RepID=A0A226EIJ1_FOLCA|nr:uncharacterized protein LOC110847885 [Folsomia candida]OXA57462.1 hypothetical protein Fcan01_07824 [Folsomia candida]
MDKSGEDSNQENPVPVKRIRILVDMPVSKAPFNLMTCNSQGEHVELNVLQIEDESPSTSTKVKAESIIKAMLQGMIDNSGYKGTMESFWESDERKKLSDKWASHVKKSKNDTEKYTPLEVFYNNDKIAMQLVDGLLQVVKMKKVGTEWKFNGWSGRQQKCSISACTTVCQVGKFCSTHAPREVLLIQDMRATPPVLALLNLDPTSHPYTESEIRKKIAGCGAKKLWRGKEMDGGTELRNQNIQLYEYAVRKSASKEETFFRIIGRWPYQDDNNKLRASVYLAVSLMVMIKGGATLLNSKILFVGVDLTWVKSFLNHNGVLFEKGDQVQESANSTPPGVSGEINRCLPYVYLGRNDKGQFYTGVQNCIQLRTAGAKSPYHDVVKAETGMDSFTDDEHEVIFQSPIPKLLQNVVSSTKRTKFSQAEEAEFCKMEEAANKYETLAHSALKIGEMVGQTYKGALVKGMPKQLNHIEGAINFVDLMSMYSFLFESYLVMKEVSQLEIGGDGKVVITFVV